MGGAFHIPTFTRTRSLRCVASNSYYSMGILQLLVAVAVAVGAAAAEDPSIVTEQGSLVFQTDKGKDIRFKAGDGIDTTLAAVLQDIVDGSLSLDTLRSKVAKDNLAQDGALKTAVAFAALQRKGVADMVTNVRKCLIDGQVFGTDGKCAPSPWMVAAKDSTCNAGSAGKLKYTVDGLQVCGSGSEWNPVSPPVMGKYQDGPGSSCQGIKAARFATGNGIYWLGSSGMFTFCAPHPATALEGISACTFPKFAQSSLRLVLGLDNSSVASVASGSVTCIASTVRSLALALSRRRLPVPAFIYIAVGGVQINHTQALAHFLNKKRIPSRVLIFVCTDAWVARSLVVMLWSVRATAKDARLAYCDFNIDPAKEQGDGSSKVFFHFLVCCGATQNMTCKRTTCAL